MKNRKALAIPLLGVAILIFLAVMIGIQLQEVAKFENMLFYFGALVVSLLLIILAVRIVK